MNRRKRIALLHASAHDLPFQNQTAYDEWFQQFDEISLIADIEPSLASVPARPNNGGYISRIARRIVRDWNRHDGFIVVFDQHHFVYASQLLAQMFHDIGKPVVCVTSTFNIVPENVEEQRLYIDLDLRAHLLNAVQLATMDVAGVVVALDSVILPAENIATDRASSTFQIQSIDGSHYGWITFGMQLLPHAPKRSDQRPYKDDIVDFSNLSFIDITADTSEIKVPDNTKAVIVRANEVLPLTVVDLLPHGCSALLVAPDAVYMFFEGHIVPVNHIADPEVVAARFSWFASDKMKLDGPELVEAVTITV